MSTESLAAAGPWTQMWPLAAVRARISLQSWMAAQASWISMALWFSVTTSISQISMAPVGCIPWVPTLQVVAQTLGILRAFSVNRIYEHHQHRTKTHGSIRAMNQNMALGRNPDHIIWIFIVSDLLHLSPHSPHSLSSHCHPHLVLPLPILYSLIIFILLGWFLFCLEIGFLWLSWNYVCRPDQTQPHRVPPASTT